MKIISHNDEVLKFKEAGWFAYVLIIIPIILTIILFLPSVSVRNPGTPSYLKILPAFFGIVVLLFKTDLYITLDKPNDIMIEEHRRIIAPRTKKHKLSDIEKVMTNDRMEFQKVNGRTHYNPTTEMIFIFKDGKRLRYFLQTTSIGGSLIKIRFHEKQYEIAEFIAKFLGVPYKQYSGAEGVINQVKDIFTGNH